MKKPIKPDYPKSNSSTAMNNFAGKLNIYKKRMAEWKQHVQDMYEGKLFFGSDEYGTKTPFILFCNGIVWCADTRLTQSEELYNLGMLTFEQHWILDGKKLSIEDMEELIQKEITL